MVESTDELTRRLQAAARQVPVPPFLETKIRAHIREEPGVRWWTSFQFAATALGLVVCVGGVAYQLGHLRLTTASQEAYVRSVSSQISTLLRVGLGDHIHCSLFRQCPKALPSTQEFIEQSAPQYAGLVNIVRSRVPETYRMTLAHQCRYNGRKFVHLSLKDDLNMMSLVMTRKTPGESFTTEEMLPALTQAGIPMYQTGVQRFQLTAFETNDYLVYFISDLSRQQNTDLMLALAPEVKDFLSKLEL